MLDAAYFVTGSELTRSRYVAYLAWFTLIVTFVLLANLSRSRVGRRWRAVRDDEVAAELAGIDLGRARISAFMVSAAAAGAAGAVMAFAVRLAAPSGFTLTLSLTLLTAVVLGGLGSLTGALIGAALLTFLPDVVSDVGRDAGLTDIQAAQLAPLVYGLVMVAVILLAPARDRRLPAASCARTRPHPLVVDHRSSPDRRRDHLEGRSPMNTATDTRLRRLVVRAGASRRRARARPPAAAADREGGGERLDVGVTDDSVKIGGHFPLTGVAAPGYSEIPTGAQGLLRLRQRRRRRARPQDRVPRPDDGYDPTKTSTVTNELVLKDEIFAMVGGARHADPRRGRGLPQRRGRARPVRLLRLAAVGRRPREAARGRSAGRPTTRARAR